MTEQEKAGSQGDPEREIAMWLEKAAEADRKRSGFQDMAAEGLVTLDESRAELALAWRRPGRRWRLRYRPCAAV